MSKLALKLTRSVGIPKLSVKMYNIAMKIIPLKKFEPTLAKR